MNRIELRKIPECKWGYSWELPYFYYPADEETQLIVNYLEPCQYSYDYQPIFPTDEDISAYIFTEWLEAGWCPAVDVHRPPRWWLALDEVERAKYS